MQTQRGFNKVHLSSSTSNIKKTNLSGNSFPNDLKTRSSKKNSDRNRIIIIRDGENVTPKPLGKVSKDKLRKKTISFLKKSHTGLISNLNVTAASVFQSTFQSKLISHIQNFNTTDLKDIFNFPNTISEEQIKEEEEHAEKVEEEEIQEMDYAEEKIVIRLTETPVFYIFEWISEVVIKDSEEAQLVQDDNDYYEYLTTGKGKNRKTTSIGIQTNSILCKNRSTLAPRTKNLNKFTFASVWDMFDTFHNLNKKQINNEKILNADEQMINLIKKDNFQMSVLIMERVLANKQYNTEQKRFRGLLEPDPFRPNIKFKYDLDLLWSFTNPLTKGKPVTTMQWNPNNGDILAVGYGTYYYNEPKTGVLFLWNIKNPIQPEREYVFETAVTALAFSNKEPNLIAIGLYDGTVRVLDICDRVPKTLFASEKTSPIRSSIWKIIWIPPDDYEVNEEHLVCGSQDGHVMRFKCSKFGDMEPICMYRVTRTLSAIKGIEHLKMCSVNDILLSNYTSACSLSINPVDHDIYYVGTCEGSLHTCSRNFLLQNMDVYLAHNGPIYSIEFSPFSTKLFLTCGADANINLWVGNIKEPIDILNTSLESVEGAVWSPNNATIIASISGKYINMWDIQRKTYLPTAVHKNPNNVNNTEILFTKTGKNLVVGDVQGNVHVYALENMPIQPFYPKNILQQVISKVLITKPELSQKIWQAGGLNWTSNEKLHF